MNMNINEMLPYVTYLLVAIGVIALSLVLCPVALVALMAWLGQPITWYMIFGCMIAAFIVALVAMDGWERVAEIWKRTKYSGKQ